MLFSRSNITINSVFRVHVIQGISDDTLLKVLLFFIIISL